MSLFKNKKEVSRMDFKSALRRATLNNTKIGPKEREIIERDVLSYSKYGSIIQLREMQEAIQLLQRKLHQTSGNNEKQRIAEKIRVLKRLI